MNDLARGRDLVMVTTVVQAVLNLKYGPGSVQAGKGSRERKRLVRQVWGWYLRGTMPAFAPHLKPPVFNWEDIAELMAAKLGIDEEALSAAVIEVVEARTLARGRLAA